MPTQTVSSQLRAADSADWDQVWDSWRCGPLRPLAAEDLPQVIAAYNETKHWQARAAQLYYVTGFARTRNEVLRFAYHALNDKSIAVRYRACAIFAFSRRRRWIPKLQQALETADRKTAPYLSAAIETIESKSLESFRTLDTPRRNLYHLPVSLPCRMLYGPFAEEFDAAAWNWLRQLGFERQSVFQHDAYYRKGDIWFHAYWEQWDVLWLFMLGPKDQLKRSYLAAGVPQPCNGGTLKEASRLLHKEVAAHLEDRDHL